MANVDQKAYLKKYLDHDHSKKRKKRRRDDSSSYSDRVKIIDDDCGYKHKRDYDEDNELLLTGEDAPQIVGIVDDRPPELKTAEDFRSNSKWRSVSSSNNNSSRDRERRRSQTPPQNRKDYSPRRTDGDRKDGVRRRRDSDDLSPVRRRHGAELKRSMSTEKDLSPARRRNNRNSDDDLSRIRKPKRSAQSNNGFSPKRKRSQRQDGDFSPKRKSGFISLRKDFSPVRNEANRKSNDVSPRRRSHLGDSPPPTHKKADHKSNKRQNSNSDNEKMKRTLDGKRAGLQNAAMLKKETEEFRCRENEMFSEMSNELSGRDAEVTVRDKRSGKIRDLQKHREKEREKEKREKARQEVYSRWGKGLKQVEEYQSKVADEMYEGSKPLARYSNDADLDEMLKGQERDGDPMLQYVREKKRKGSIASKVPLYNGPYPENRFNIRPGYRWDGVDRSNGYEKKWLDVQNNKVAVQEEAYKYSIEDM